MNLNIVRVLFNLLAIMSGNNKTTEYDLTIILHIFQQSST